MPALLDRLRRPMIIGGLAAAALAGTALTVLPGLAQGPAQAPVVALPRANMAAIGGPDFADVAARVAPSVVRVIAIESAAKAQPTVDVPPELRGTPFEELFRRRGAGPAAEPQPRRAGQGSGFVIDEAGFIVTNAHVVGGSSEVRVELADGRDFAARVVGSDQATDIALLKIEGAGRLAALPFADSDRARVGEWLMAMGNPFGLGGTVTVGVLSARGRQIGAGPYDDFIQTDAPINPGNSGGPLFNSAGEVVGINTAIFSPSGGNVGIGFAVPSNMVTKVVAALRDRGYVERGWLGVSLQPLDRDLAEAMRIADAKGALVNAVEPDGPAARAGIQAGDVITRIGGRSVASPRDLAAGVAETTPGTQARLALVRNGTAMEMRVEVGENPASRQASRPAGTARPSLGLALAPRAEGGVSITRVEPGSTAAELGLRAGDVILRAGDREMARPQDVAAAVAAAREAGKASIPMQIERGQAKRFVAVPLRAA